MDKTWLIEQLKQKISESANVADIAAQAAQEQAKSGATPQERRQDNRVAIENGRMAQAQAKRAAQAKAELAALEKFVPLARSPRVALGSIVDIEDDEGVGRTIFFAPVGAGTTLTGPGGDGFLTVVTPTSPLGKAMRGRITGDVVDITVRGDVREWEILDIG